MLDLRIGSFSTRPNGLDSVKNEDYHIQTARWCVGMSNTKEHMEWQNNLKIARNFISPNKQWELPEDKVNFLMDESGQTTNRVKVELNYCHVMHNQYVGNASRMQVNARIQSFSPLVKTRKESSLNEMLLWQDAAMMASPQVANTIRANKPIGESDLETAQLHDVYYSDKYVRAMNSMVRRCAKINNMDLLKREVAESLSYSGVAVVRPEPVGGEYRVRWVQPDRFFWDRAARSADLSDAGFMGEYEDMLVSDLYEVATELRGDDRSNIEAYLTSINSLGTTAPDRVRCYKVVWRDVNIAEWGYVENEFGDIVFEKINCIYENEETARYKDSDLVPLSKLTEYQLGVLRKKKQSKGLAKTTCYTDQWRYCDFIPSEYIATNNTSQTTFKDIVIGYGILPYQEQNTYSPYNMETPYKVSLYMYLDGYTYSPIDIAINPQRLANRIMSVVENTMNNAMGSGVLLSQEAVDRSDMNLEEITTRMKRNEPVTVAAAPLGGVQNSVGKYDGGITNGTMGMLNVAQIMLGSIEKISGVNEAMKGGMDNPDQLVGTMQLQIQKGTVVTERYYAALRDLFRQVYQAFCSSGKRFYINEKPTLISMVGDEDADVIVLSKDMKNEDFRASVEFAIDPKSERQGVDAMLFQLLQIGLMDKVSWSNLIGRASEDDMWEAVRRYAKESSEAEKVAAQQQEQQAAAMQQQQQQNVDGALGVQQSKIQGDLLKEAMKIEAQGGKNNTQM